MEHSSGRIPRAARTIPCRVTTTQSPYTFAPGILELHRRFPSQRSKQGRQGAQSRSSILRLRGEIPSRALLVQTCAADPRWEEVGNDRIASVELDQPSLLVATGYSTPCMNRRAMEGAFKVAAVQTSPCFLDLRGTVAKACDFIREAANHGASIVAFPEAFIPAYPYWAWLDNPLESRKRFHALYRNSITIPGECAGAGDRCQTRRHGLLLRP